MLLHQHQDLSCLKEIIHRLPKILTELVACAETETVALFLEGTVVRLVPDNPEQVKSRREIPVHEVRLSKAYVESLAGERA